MSNTDSGTPTAASHFALQTLIRYLRAHTDVTEVELAKDLDGITTDIVANYLNRPSKSLDKRADTFFKLRTRVKELCDARKIASEDFAYISSLYDSLYNRSSQGRRPPETDIQNWATTDLAGAKNTLGEFAGFWRVLRISTTRWDDAEVPEYSYSLLNITVPDFITESLPTYKLYSRGKDVVEHYESFAGFLLVRPNRIWFVGAEESDKNPMLLSWPHRRGEERQHKRATYGLIKCDNSSSVPISAYVYAEYIDGSDGWRGDRYTEQKNLERTRIGVRTLKELEKFFPSETLGDALAKLTEWPRRESIFQLKT